MADEPTLPRLSAPAVSWNSQTQSFSARGPNKRTRDNDSGADLFSNSSDPAFFSSDDDPALENYLQGKRKKQKNVGSWFSQEPASGNTVRARPQTTTTKPRRTLERHLDSGVWLGSDGTDGTDTEESDFMLSQPAPSRMLALQPRKRKGFQRVESLRITSAEQAARRRIQECIEDGTEDVDLVNLGLDSLSSATIEPLAEFSCIPLVTEGVNFEQKPPELRLYLGNNQLTRLPGALFSNDLLTVLSVRGNQLRELPSCIGQLHNLKTLNVSFNNLNYLPAELLDLMRGPALEEVLLDPNPFYEWKLVDEQFDWTQHVKDAQQGTRPITGEVGEKGAQVTIQARTDVQISDSTGRIRSAFNLPPHYDTPTQVTAKSIWVQMAEQAAEQKDSVSIRTPPTKVPSLVELVFRQCSSAPELSDLPALLPEDSPPYMLQTMQRALDQREAGGLRCSVCESHMVTPMAQWIEFWAVWKRNPLFGPLRIPFLRQACSSMCAAAFRRGPECVF